MKKRIVRMIDVTNHGDILEVRFHLFNEPNRAFKILPARWNRLMAQAKECHTEIFDVADSLYHSVLLIFSENKTGVFQ